MDFINGILDVLCDLEILTRSETVALEEDFESNEAEYFEDYLVDEGIVEKEGLLQALEQYYSVPAIDVLGEIFDHKLLIMFPKDVLLRNCCIPYRHDGQLLVIITSNPKNEDLDAILGNYVSYDFEFYVGIPRHIDMMIKDFYQDELYEDDYETNLDRERVDREIVELDEED